MPARNACLQTLTGQQLIPAMTEFLPLINAVISMPASNDIHICNACLHCMPYLKFLLAMRAMTAEITMPEMIACNACLAYNTYFQCLP
jgi:hypothetical protein